MAAADSPAQMARDLASLSEIRALVVQSLCLLDDADDSIKEEPRLLQKIGLQEGQMEQVAAQLRTLLDQVSRAKDAALNALTAHGATPAPEAATAETTESAARLTAEGAGSETATEQ